MKLNLQIDSDHVAPGGRVRGSVEVVEGGRARSLEVRLLRLPQCEYELSVVIEDRVALLQAESELQAGTSYEFELSVPGTATPTCESPHGRIEWMVDVKADVPRGLDFVAERSLLVSVGGTAGPERYDQAATTDIEPVGQMSSMSIWGFLLALAGAGIGAFVLFNDKDGVSSGIIVAGGLILIGLLLLLLRWRRSAGQAKRFSMILDSDSVVRGAEMKGRVEVKDVQDLDGLQVALVCWENYKVVRTHSKGSYVELVTNCMHIESQDQEAASPNFSINVPTSLPPSSTPAALYFEWEVVLKSTGSGRTRIASKPVVVTPS